MTGSVVERFGSCVEVFDAVLATVGPDDWDRPTPCDDWDVRALVAHLVDEQRWIPPLLAGDTLEQAAATLDDDVLGADPLATWVRHRRAAAEAVAALDDLDTPVHVSFGQIPAHHYLAQLAADHLVHAWDLARAVGGDEHLPAGMVAEVSDWFDAGEAALWRSAEVVADPVATPDDAPPQTRMLAAFGRDARAT